jgi:hypothetical protein
MRIERLMREMAASDTPIHEQFLRLREVAEQMERDLAVAVSALRWIAQNADGPAHGRAARALRELEANGQEDGL